MIWGHYDNEVGPRPTLSSIKRFVKGKITNTVSFSAYNMSDLIMRTYADRIKKLHPKVIYGYASALETFARFLSDRNIDLGCSRPDIVISTAEVLHDKPRLLMEQAYGCSVASEYGSSEGGMFAFECPEGGLHVMEESLYMEVVDERGHNAEGGVGEVVITQLDNYSVPLIRYRMGDLVQISPKTCSCGRSWRMLDSVKGRKYGIFYGINGNRIHSGIVTELLWEIPGVKRFQAIQDSVGHVRILIIPSGTVEFDHLDKARRDAN